jgi:hypothetical protein
MGFQSYQSAQEATSIQKHTGAHKGFGATSSTSATASERPLRLGDDWRCARPSPIQPPPSVVDRFQLPWVLRSVRGADFHSFMDPGKIPPSLLDSAFWIRDNITGRCPVVLWFDSVFGKISAIFI